MPAPVICLRDACGLPVDRGHLFCEGHVNDHLGVAVTRELRSLRETLEPLRTAHDPADHDVALALLAEHLTRYALERRFSPTLQAMVDSSYSDLRLRHIAGLRLAMVAAVLDQWDPNHTWWEARQKLARARARFGPEIEPEPFDEEDDDPDQGEDLPNDDWKLTPEQRRQRWLAQRPDDPLLSLSGKALQEEYERLAWEAPPWELQKRIHAIAAWEAGGEME